MKRSLRFVAAASLLALTACKHKKDESPAEAPARAAVSAPGPALGYAEERLDAARGRTDALATVVRADETAGRRLFDGDALRREGFALPDESAVYVPLNGSARPTPLAAALRGAPRRASDLGRREPPAPRTVARTDPALARAAGAVLAEFVAFQQECYAQVLPTLGRAGWGAARRRGAPVPMRPTHVTVHHTDGPQTVTEADTAAAVREIQRFHMQDDDGRHGWDDIGYHFLIDGAGRVVEGRPAETLGAHAGGANQDNIGVAMMGDFNKIRPTDAQVEALTRLVSFLALKYKQDPSRAGFLEPHQHYNNTDCPGKNMMAILQSLHERIDQRTSSLTVQLERAAPGQFVPVLTTNA